MPPGGSSAGAFEDDGASSSPRSRGEATKGAGEGGLCAEQIGEKATAPARTGR